MAPSAPTLAIAIAVGCCSFALQGCESDYEKHVRQSCNWDPDVKLVGCDEAGFKQCIGNCEYCLGGIQTVFEGRDDECAQLKCGAFCARRDGAACSATYQQLCQGALDVLGAGCDVQCSGAARSRPAVGGLAAALASVLLAGGGARAASCRQVVVLVAVAAAAVLLQGCGSPCAPATPSLPEWSVDLTRLDRTAGCQDEWDWLWGNPCAFDVPVIFAKRGLEADADEAFIKGRVRNERHTCEERAAGGYCQRWTSLRESCETEELSVCACLAPANGSGYCARWQCVSKRASQRICREACCGDSCTPCVECGMHGSSRYPMSSARYSDLLVAGGAVGSSPLGRPEALRLVREGYWSNFDLAGECVAPRHVGAPAEVPCKSWREIATGLSTCRCRRSTPGLDHCEAWSCSEQRAGMFSVLFARDTSYEGLVEDAEPRRYECAETVQLAGGRAACRLWRGEAGGHRRVATMQCQATCSSSACDNWACNEYELPRVHGREWLDRLLLSAAHLCWMWLPLLIVARGRARGGCNVLGLSPCGLVFACFLIWAPGFLRWLGDEGRWRAPGRPFLGLLLMLGPTWALAATIWALGSKRLESWSPMLVVAPPMLIAGLAWTNGLVAAGGLAGIFLLVAVCTCCCVGRQAQQQEGSDAGGSS